MNSYYRGTDAQGRLLPTKEFQDALLRAGRPRLAWWDNPVAARAFDRAPMDARENLVAADTRRRRRRLSAEDRVVLRAMRRMLDEHCRRADSSDDAGVLNRRARDASLRMSDLEYFGMCAAGCCGMIGYQDFQHRGE